MKKMLSLLFLFSFPSLALGIEVPKHHLKSDSQFNFYPPQLHLAVKAILQVPECCQLINEVQKQGAVGLRYENIGNPHSDAAWYGDQRIIALNSLRKRSEGQKICSIIFELHNALNNHKFIEIDQLAIQKKIDKETYVESIERLEHQNALNTKLLLEKGIQQGVFPKDASWSILHDFNDHYKVQQIMGHAFQIGYIYDSLNPQGKKNYIGTISFLDKLTLKEKKKMLSYFSLKDSLEFGNEFQKEQARRLLHQIYWENSFKPHSYKGSENSYMLVLNEVFKNNLTFEEIRKKPR